MLEEVKKYLNITWDDEDVNSKLNMLIGESKIAISVLMGATVDFNQLEFKELLFNRIRYSYNNSLEYFEENFSKEILRLQLKVGVDNFENLWLQKKPVSTTN